MFEVREKPQQVEKALLVGFYFSNAQEEEARALLLELEDLVDTLGIEVSGMELVKVRDMHRGLICRSGKADELVALAREKGCEAIVIDNSLSPMQQRNWEKLADLTVIDREEVILDIFAQRARTREAKLQVDLARMEYALPRLARMWGHLDREGGGGGGGAGGQAARGMGEQQIEIDRRLARERISQTRRELEVVRRQRATQRKVRERNQLASAALVGYTNAGKSTLLNRLAQAEVYEADELFATLDPTTRRIELSNGQPLLLSDTVGFVRNLPHRLVEAFKATLEEALLADFLIHVLDASSPEILQHYETTRSVLAELGAEDKPSLLLLNKMDCLQEEEKRRELQRRWPEAIAISARSGWGIERLEEQLSQQLSSRLARVTLRIPQRHGDVVHQIHECGKVLSRNYEGGDVLLEAIIPKEVRDRNERWLVTDSSFFSDLDKKDVARGEGAS